MPIKPQWIYVILLFVWLGRPEGGTARSAVVYLPDTGDFISQYRIPILLSMGLIGGGVVTYHPESKKAVQEWLLEHIDHRRTVEDYLQHGSYGLLIGGQLAGYRPLHTPKGQFIYALIANVGAVGVTSILKELIDERRPNGGRLSFPSGHTTHAFAAATVLYWEYRDTEPVLAYSGYSFALATGLLRMIHNRHWINDVLAGAGIGILVPTLVYCKDPFPRMRRVLRNGPKVSYMPVIGRRTYGVAVRWRL